MRTEIKFQPERVEDIPFPGSGPATSLPEALLKPLPETLPEALPQSLREALPEALGEFSSLLPFTYLGLAFFLLFV